MNIDRSIIMSLYLNILKLKRKTFIESKLVNFQLGLISEKVCAESFRTIYFIVPYSSYHNFYLYLIFEIGLKIHSNNNNYFYFIIRLSKTPIIEK